MKRWSFPSVNVWGAWNFKFTNGSIEKVTIFLFFLFLFFFFYCEWYFWHRNMFFPKVNEIFRNFFFNRFYLNFFLNILFSMSLSPMWRVSPWLFRSAIVGRTLDIFVFQLDHSTTVKLATIKVSCNRDGKLCWKWLLDIRCIAD